VFGNRLRDDAARKRQVFRLQQSLLQVKIIGAFLARSQRKWFFVVFAIRKSADCFF
jgi:hypothetical protein